MWSRPRRCWRETRGVSFDEIARANHGQFLSPVQQSAAPGAARRAWPRQVDIRNDAEIHHSRLRLIRRRAAAGAGLGRLRSEQSEKPPPAHLALGRARAADGGGATRVLIDTPPDLREQLLDAEVDWLDGVLYTHEHADHTHGIDDLRAFFHQAAPARRRLSRRTRPQRSMHARFGYCFQSPPGSDYPPIVTEHRLAAGTPVTIAGEGGPIKALPFRQEHGDIASLGFRFGKLAYSCDLSGLPPESVAALAGPRCLDRRRAALPAASEPFLARRRARLDRAAQAAPRHPDQSARRPRLRGSARQTAGPCRAGFRRDDIRSFRSRVNPGIYRVCSIICLMRIMDY